MTKPHVNIPVDSIYDIQRSLSGVEIAAYLTADPISDKKPSRLTDVAFHSVRPWLAAIDPKGVGLVWNYETREIVAEFSLGISPDVSGDGEAAAGDDEFGGTSTPTTAKTLLQKTASPTTSYVKALRTKTTSFAMLFYDHESICWTTKSHEPRQFFEEWIIILTSTHVVLCDLNQPTAIRSVSSEELQRQAPCSIAILPSGLLAIGCQDGKIRLWSPRLWRVVDTIDTGSTKEVQQLLLLPLTVQTDTPVLVHFLTSVTLDGRLVTWKVSSSGECVKVPGVVELREFYRAFDASNGLSELRFHEHQEIVSGASKDGTVYFLDLTPLTRQSKQMTLMSILPTTKLPGACVVAGPRKGAFVVISLAASGSAVTISELVNKGRAVGRDNVPANYVEFGVGASMESRDLRVPIGQAALKKCKMLALCGNPRDAKELCCVTSFGLFVLRATCLASARPIMIARGANKSPLVLYPGPCRITLRFYGEETSSKQEGYKFQAAGSDAPNERLKTPTLLACPVNPSFMAALLPASTHVEVIQMDSELRNQKSINMHAVFSGNGIALAWHATKPRFAVLVPQDSNARRLTRAVSNVNAPKRRGFMFGGSSKGGLGDDASESRPKSSASARAMTLAMYDITADGHVQSASASASENLSCGDDRLLHIFSGPFLGVVKFEADSETTGSSGPASSFVGAGELHDSPSMRNKRTESSMFSPTNAGSSGGNSGSSASLSFADGDAGDLKKTTLEFFDWECGSSSGTALTRIGSGAIDAPLKIEWERVTHRFCALVYARVIKIYRVTAAPVAEAVCLHTIPTSQTVHSLKWLHHTLFISTEDEITCCVISRTRVFSFAIGSRLGFLESTTSTEGPGAGAGAGDPAMQFPPAQRFVTDATTILDICNQQLVLAAPVQSLHTLALSNRVLQCCLLVSIGQADLGVQVADALPGELADWLASVFEAFAFVAQAMKLAKTSLPCKINMAIKHNLLDELERVVQSPQLIKQLPIAHDTTGTSLLQRACTCLHRGGRTPVVEAVCRMMMTEGRSTDAIFLASLLNNDELFASALESQEHYAGAFHSAKRSNLSAPTSAQDVLNKWNSQLHSATAPWKTVLSRHAIRAPENITLALK